MQTRRRWYVDIRATSEADMQVKVAQQDAVAGQAGYVRVQNLPPRQEGAEWVFPLVYEEAPRGHPAAGPRSRQPSVVVVAIVLLVITGGWVYFDRERSALSSPRTTPTAAPGNQSRSSVSRSGESDQVTSRFRLEGDYRLDWTATDTGGTTVGCAHFAHLRPGLHGDVSAEAPGGGTKEGSTYIYGLEAGEYHFEVISGCKWSLTLVPQ